MFKLISTVVTRDQIKEYAKASGDFNPIHTDLEAAKKAGLQDCIAHGMLIMALGSSAIREWGVQSVKTYDVRFQSMTYPDEPLVLKGQWTDEGAGKGLITVENEEGEIKMKGTFTV
ncbi:MaoC family dehydratase [Domibacillus epiphyticus]|uniref:MaoC-like domain-containing protein n=1 Tax=Domibacillus epiphyticus TaxID=1714355 RepID=A0A1V2A4X1_9BACI|nr:MaoC family dehydratase [Domibacillus epiphyticus]OMP66068.1 hypothetical protein BTO28_13755 [Domibacillus epiphyticus]